MFTEADGPTALRADLVYALSFSAGAEVLETEDGHERCCAAISGVWNGRKGYVALLVRRLETSVVKRYVFANALSTLDEVWQAVEAALAHSESLGFPMDDPEFLGLTPAEKDGRLEAWNDVRKPSRSVRHLGEGGKQVPGVPREFAPDEDDDPPTQPFSAPPPEASPAPAKLEPERDEAAVEEDDGGNSRSVLGRVAIVRRRAGRWMDPFARLLSHF